MKGAKRRARVLEIIRKAPNVVSATAIAKEVGVSRQIIVGDVALLRASGEQIIATARGYKLDNSGKHIYQITVKHNEKQIKNELTLLVENGVTILDVIVEHPFYGTIKGDLNITTSQDIENYLKLSGNPLLLLTDGLHTHTIICNSDDHFNRIKQVLKENNFLVD